MGFGRILVSGDRCLRMIPHVIRPLTTVSVFFTLAIHCYISSICYFFLAGIFKNKLTFDKKAKEKPKNFKVPGLIPAMWNGENFQCPAMFWWKKSISWVNIPHFLVMGFIRFFVSLNLVFVRISSIKSMKMLNQKKMNICIFGISEVFFCLKFIDLQSFNEWFTCKMISFPSSESPNLRGRGTS